MINIIAPLIAAIGSVLMPAVRLTHPDPPPTTTTEYVAQYMTRCPQWEELAIEVGWETKDLPTLDYIMFRESRCNPDAHNPSGAACLLQEMPFWWRGQNPYDPATCLTIGLTILHTQGWSAWSTYGR